jgi:hypothetical protein
MLGLMFASGLRIWNTGVKSISGWSYVVLTIQSYGIGNTRKTKIDFYFRNNNLARVNETVSSFSILDIPLVPTDSVLATSWNMFGHKGPRTLVSTSMHFSGIMNRFKVTESYVMSIS